MDLPSSPGWRTLTFARKRKTCIPDSYPLLSLDLHLERGAGSQTFKYKLSASSTPQESTLHPVTVPFHPKEEEALLLQQREWSSVSVQMPVTPHTTTGLHQTKPERKQWRSRPTKEGVILANPLDFTELQVAQLSSFHRTTESSII